MIRIRVLLALSSLIAYGASGGTSEECLDDENGCPPPIPVRPVPGQSLDSHTFPWTTNTTLVNSTLLNDVRIVASPRARLWQKYAQDLKVCMEFCTNECQVIDYDRLGQICNAYDGGADVTFAQSYYFVVFSPIRKQVARLSGFRGAADLIDLEYENKNLERSLQEGMTELLCQKLCLIHPRCEAAIFDVTLESCQLKRQPHQRSRIQQKPIADQGSITFFSIWKKEKDFVLNSLWTDEECNSWKTGGCSMFGCNYIVCRESASDADIGKHFEKVGRYLQERSPIQVEIDGKLSLEPASLEPILDRVIRFEIVETRGFDSMALSPLHFPNLKHLRFFRSRNVIVRKGTMNNFPQLRLLEFGGSTILHLEAGVFDGLPELKTLVLDYFIDWRLHDDHRAYIWKLHCSREYSWFRTYLTKNPHLIQPRSTGEVYSEAGIYDSGWSRREIYGAVDCQKDNLQGLDNQTEFSLNPES